MNNLSQQTTASTRDFFVVQKCWFDGPHIAPPVDYLRLLCTRAEAEAVAYESAHTYSHGAPVRTVPATQGSGFNFSTCGKLFWVRQVQATVVQLNDCQNTQYPHAHAVLTNGVLGGTGNVNSRATVNTGRVFVGPPAVASQWALRVAQQLQQEQQLDQHASYVTWLPVGPPKAPSQLLQEWPDRDTWAPADEEMQSNSRQHDRDDHEQVVEAMAPVAKRQCRLQQQHHHLNNAPTPIAWNSTWNTTWGTTTNAHSVGATAAATTMHL